MLLILLFLFSFLLILIQVDFPEDLLKLILVDQCLIFLRFERFLSIFHLYVFMWFIVRGSLLLHLQCFLLFFDFSKSSSCRQIAVSFKTVGVLLAFGLLWFIVMWFFIFHQLNLIMSLGTASISSSSLILRIVFRWFVVFYVLAELCDSWAYLNGTMHKPIVVEVRIIDWIKSSSLCLA